MKTFLKFGALFAASALAAQAQEALTIGPKHRYSFGNASGSLAAGTQVSDSIGTAHATIRGSGASGTGTGVRLVGGSPASAAYIDLPNSSISGSAEIFPGLDEASYEVWLTVHSPQSWSRILDFGNNSSDEITGPGGSFSGADYLMVSANIGTANDMRFERGGQSLTGGGTQDIGGATTIGAAMHIVVTYDIASFSWKLYKNGTQIGSIPTLLGPGTIDDLNVWLGRSNWSGDGNSDATYDEFRVYDYSLSAQEVLGNYQAGPDVVTSDPGPANQAPSFASDPVLQPNATATVAYGGSIAASATDPDPGDTLSFSKLGGPAWLSIAGDGTLGGTPGTGDEGVNQWTVEVSDGELTDTATLRIVVDPAPNQAPEFSSSLLVKSNATEGSAYGGSLAGDASDPDPGDTLTFSKTGGPAWLAVAGDGTLSGTPGSGNVGTNQWTVQVSDGTLTDAATLQVTVDALPASASYGANGETMVAGTIVSGSYSSTLSSDNSYEELRETESGGKPSRRHSYLEHVWTFDLGSGGSQVTLSVEAHHSVNIEGDDFVFAYSTDGSSYTDAITVTKIADDNGAQTAQLPAGTSGTVHIRVKDTDQSRGARFLDSLFVDALEINVDP